MCAARLFQSPEVRQRAVAMVREHRRDYSSHWNAIVPLAAKIDCAAQTLNEWLKSFEVDSGELPGMSADLLERLKVQD